MECLYAPLMRIEAQYEGGDTAAVCVASVSTSGPALFTEVIVRERTLRHRSLREHRIDQATLKTLVAEPLDGRAVVVPVPGGSEQGCEQSVVGDVSGIDVLAVAQGAVSASGDDPWDLVVAVRPRGDIAAEDCDGIVEHAVLQQPVEEVSKDL